MGLPKRFVYHIVLNVPVLMPRAGHLLRMVSVFLLALFKSKQITTPLQTLLIKKKLDRSETAVITRLAMLNVQRNHKAY